MSFCRADYFLYLFQSTERISHRPIETCCQYKPLQANGNTESLTSLPKSFAEPTVQLKGWTARIMFIHWTFFLSCGPTQNENEVQKKTFYTPFFEHSVFGSARVGLSLWAWASNLGLDLRLGRWNLRLDTSGLQTSLALSGVFLQSVPDVDVQNVSCVDDLITIIELLLHDKHRCRPTAFNRPAKLNKAWSDSIGGRFIIIISRVLQAL